MGNAYSPSSRVSPRGGVAVISASGYLTATDIAIREVYIQAARANTSVAYMNINTTCTVTSGFEIPKAVGTVAVANQPLVIPIASLTSLYILMTEVTDFVQVLYRS
jgi:hypothetical protein